MTSPPAERSDTALRNALGSILDDAIGTFERLGVRSPVPWPRPGPLRLRGGARVEYLFSLWSVAADAVEWSAEQLVAPALEAAESASDDLLWVAQTFEQLEHARREPSGQNLASLVFLGRRLGGERRPFSGPRRPRGRPPGSPTDEADRLLVQQFNQRVVAERIITRSARKRLWEEIARQAPGGGSVESKLTRLQKRQRQERNNRAQFYSGDGPA